MSGKGSPRVEVGDTRSLRVAVVAARWHADVVDALVAGATRALRARAVPDPAVFRVAGSFELPVVAGALAGHGYDALVCLGVVVRGETPHFEYVCQAATWGLTEVSLRTGVPIGFGVLTCDTEEQAYTRAGLPDSREDKGAEAALAAVSTALTLRDLRIDVVSAH